MMKLLACYAGPFTLNEELLYIGERLLRTFSRLPMVHVYSSNGSRLLQITLFLFFCQVA